MTLIEGLLDEVRQQGADPAIETVEKRTRFLVGAYQSGAREQETLRKQLAQHVASSAPQVESAEQGLDRLSKADLQDWDNEGGAAHIAGYRKNKNLR
jgi:hypothetical protein